MEVVARAAEEKGAAWAVASLALVVLRLCLVAKQHMALQGLDHVGLLDYVVFVDQLV